MKKILSLILALAVVLCALPFGAVTVSAAEEYTTALNGATLYYSVSNGEATITDCDTSIRGAVTLPTTLDDYPVTSIGNGAFYNCGWLTYITIPDSVTSIGAGAFAWCESLLYISMPNSIISIGDSAFNGCDRLLRVDITNLTSWCNIDFGDTCSNPLYPHNGNLYVNKTLATDITIPDGVTSIDFSAFSGCGSITSVTIPDSVTSIGTCAFFMCNSLTQVIIPDSVKSIGISAFEYCGSLTQITIPKNVTNISDGTFSYCDSLTKIIIPDGVINIGDDAFRYCNSLTHIIIPDGVTNIGYCAFLGCNSLIYVTIPNSVTSIGEYAFNYCDSLEKVYYEGTEKQWNNISIGSYNTDLFDADIIFNGVIDGDVTINSSELVIIKKIILDKLSAEETKTYDINYDGEVNILDLIRLKKILASA